MDFEYKAFISYSHRDTRWAEWLLHALETYRLPDSRTRGVGRVFRDRDEAGAGDLRDEIQRALAVSENLIVIASPNSARSTYVQAEIESFVQQRAESDVRGRIVTLIVDGEPNVSAPGTIDPRECFPPALRGGIVLPDGTVFEPLAADARSEGDGRTRALAKVVAGLMDIRYDTLVRRDLRRRRRARMIAAAGTIAGVAIAGLVTAVIIAGNLEQERLRVASENAAREARTVAAVNDAERAKRLLESGNFENALDLALRSLPLDGSVPFIPQAYDVLYRLAYDRRQEVEADLAGFYRNAPVVLPAGPGHYLIYNDTGTAAIWSTSRGVVYRRSDLEWEKRPTLAADGSAIFVPGVSAMLRLSLPERIWTSIELTGIWPDLSMPDYAAAIDRSSFYACHDKQLSRIAVDDELRGTTSWHVDLPAPCNAMTLTPGGGVAIAIGSFAFEFGPDGIGRRLLGPAGDTAAERIYAVDDAIILASVGGTYSYRGYDNRPTVIEGRGMDYFALSPDGKRFTYTDSERGGVVIADLATGDDRLITCTCRFIGYLDANRILTIGDRVVEAHAVDTLASLGPVHLFAADADAFAYLPADNLLMALRQSGTESVAFLDRKGSRTLVADGNSNFREALLFAALTGSHSILTRDIGPDGVSFNLTAVAPTGSSAGAVKQALPLPARAGAAYPLSDRSFAVVTLAQDLSGWTIGAYDGDSGAEL